MSKMTVCYPNNHAIIYCNVHYDSRGSALKIMTMLNQGYINLPDYAGIVHFKARGKLYTAEKNSDAVWVLKPSKVEVKAVEP